MAPLQCEKCWLVNFCGCCPDSGRLVDRQTLAVLHRSNLDIFWICDTSTIHVMLGYEKELVIRSREVVRSVLFPTITVLQVVDEGGMGVAIQKLEKSLANRRNSKNYIQFNTIRKLRAAALDIYSATSAAHSSRYSLKYHRGSVIHMYERVMQSSLMERFAKGINNRIPEYSDQKKPLNYLVIKYILNDIGHEWVG